MGIDVYLRWKKPDGPADDATIALQRQTDNCGYLRECYHGGPHATHFLLREAWEDPAAAESLADSPYLIVRIPALTLRARCEDAMALAACSDLMECQRDRGTWSLLDRQCSDEELRAFFRTILPPHRQCYDEELLAVGRAFLLKHRALGLPLPPSANRIQALVTLAEALEAAGHEPWVYVDA